MKLVSNLAIITALFAAPAFADPVCVDPIENVGARAFIANPDGSVSVVDPFYKIADESFHIIAEQNAQRSICRFFKTEDAISSSVASVPRDSNFVFLEIDGALKYISRRSNYRGNIVTLVRCK